MGNVKVLRRVSVDFVLTEEEDKKLTSKYTALRDKNGENIVEAELYHVGYELENGDECDEDGEPV
jgi:acyl-CoA thioesterase FadM